MIMEEFIHTDETRLALKLVRQGMSFFITGRAGTGKTKLLKKIVSECRAQGKNVVVSAPTGVAAKNADGQTIHSLFRLKTSVFIPNKMRLRFKLDHAREKIVRNLDVLIIDEISMVRCDLLDRVNLTLQYYKGNKEPFGGIQVLFFGDLFQLPPVVTDEDEELMDPYYDNGFFFASDIIRKHPFKVLELTTVFRQKEDSTFVNILNNIREGKYLESDREVLNKRWVPRYEPSDKESSVYLRTRKTKVWGYNNAKLKELPGDAVPFKAYIEGDFPRPLYPTDYELNLKVGAKVMLLRNDNDGYKYVNGTLGVISSILGDEIRVKSDEGELITVDRTTWDRYEYVFDEETKTIVPVTIGSFRQFPLMLAWAVTIHKSQGMTFDNVIVDASRSFAPGQVYVALSRCRSLNGLTLSSKISANDIMVDPIVVEYMKSVERLNSDIEENEPDNLEQSIFFFSDDGLTITGMSSEVYGDITIPDGVETIAEKAFEDNTNITSVIFPASLREIGNHAFWGCKNLRTVKLNDGLVSIGVEAFIGTALEEIDLPWTLQEMDLTPFECKMKVDYLNVHFSSDINGALYNADETSLILFPRKIHEESIEVPDSVTSIESYAFENNVAAEIILPEGIEELQDKLFYGCQNLITLTLNSSTPENIEVNEEAFKGFEVENCVLRVPFEALAEYKSDERFKVFKYITAIEGSRCLMYDETGSEVVGCDENDCESLEIPEGVTSIKDNAFEDKESIFSVEFPETLTSIGNAAFSGCSGITDISLNDELERIGYDAFRGTELVQVEIPNNVNDIGPSAFTCDINVSPNNTDYIDIDGVLCNYLETGLIIYPSDRVDEDYEVPDGIETIGAYAFEDAVLHSISMPDSIMEFGADIFCGCENLKELTMYVEDPNVLLIDKDSFEGFNPKQCTLIVPHGCKAKYYSHNAFNGFLTIIEMDNDESEEIADNNDRSTGQFFQFLPEPKHTESKQFCNYDGKYHCYIVSTPKGFYLKVIGGGYYFMSEHISEFKLGRIWIRNKRERLTGYDVSYTTDDIHDTPFGHFTESVSQRTLTYRDFKTGRSFTLNLKTGEKVNNE